MAFFVGAGPTELHAHIDLDRRIQQLAPANPTVSIVATAEEAGHWSVVADVRHRPSKEGA